MLDRERADFFRTLGSLHEQLSEPLRRDPAADRHEHELTRRRRPAAQLRLHGPRRRPRRRPRGDPRESLQELAAEYREKLLDAVVETDEALMEAYLAGSELDAAAVAAALKTAVTRDELYPVACGVATRNLGTHALLDLLVEGVPSPARKPAPVDDRGGTVAFVFKTVADPFAGRISCFRVYGGTVDRRLDARQPARQGQGAARGLMTLQGKEHEKATSFGAGRHRRRREAQGRPDRRPARRQRAGAQPAAARLHRAGDELRCHAEDQG